MLCTPDGASGLPTPPSPPIPADGKRSGGALCGTLRGRMHTHVLRVVVRSWLRVATHAARRREPRTRYGSACRRLAATLQDNTRIRRSATRTEGFRSSVRERARERNARGKGV